MVTLPREIGAVQRAELIREFGEAVTGNRTPWVAAMHDMGKDAQNPHAHFIFRDRDLETGKRVLKLSDNKRDREKAGLEPVMSDERHAHRGAARWRRIVRWLAAMQERFNFAPERIVSVNLTAKGLQIKIVSQITGSTL